MKKIGYVDYYIDEWHAHHCFKTVKAYNEQTGDDFQIVAGWAEIDKEGGLSTEEFCQKYGMKHCKSIKELCEEVDFVMVLAPNNPEKKPEYVREVFAYKKPTFIDKPLSNSYASALEIYEEGKKTGTPFFSSSSLRYVTELDPYRGTATSIFTTGFGSTLEAYAVHHVEMIVACMGIGAKAVRFTLRGKQEWADIEYTDGRKAGFAISMAGEPLGFSALVVNKEGETYYRPITSNMFGLQMTEILNFFNGKELCFDSNETLEIIKIVDGIFESKKTGEKWITL